MEHSPPQTTCEQNRDSGTKIGLFTKFLLYIMAVGFFYLSYRYPLQFNAAVTSYAYKDTPFFLQLGKYFLLTLSVPAVFTYLAMQNRLKINYDLTFSILTILLFWSMIYALIYLDLRMLEIAAIFPVGIALYFFGKSTLDITLANRFLSWTILAAILGTLVQIALYKTTRRLPALAWPGGSVRYGSFLDDPNGFGLLCSFFIGFAVLYYSGMKRVLVVVFLSFCLFKTRSLTAYISFFSASAVLVSISLFFGEKRSWIKISARCLGLIAALLLGYVLFDQLALHIHEFLASKQGSIEQHIAPYRLIVDRGILAEGLAAVSPPNKQQTELGHLNLIRYFGLSFWLLYITVGVMALYRYLHYTFHSQQSSGKRAFSAGSSMYLIAYLVGLFGLPLATVFPNNLFYVLLSALPFCHVSWNEKSCSKAHVQG